MKKFKILPFLLLLLSLSTSVAAQKKTQKTYIPWSNGKLVVSEEGRYLKHENGTPFFWLGETGWLLPECLNREEAAYYLENCKQAGYNVVQIQTMNQVPSINIYGQYSLPDGFNFKNIDKKGVYGYWDHMDYIIKTAEKKGIYIGMVCIWGTPVDDGLMNVKEAQAYGKFLAERYKDAGVFGPTLIASILYMITSGCTASTQYAYAEMLRLSTEGKINFVEDTREYARRAERMKKIFTDNGFHIVYDYDATQVVGDGFFFTIGYGKMKGGELLRELLYYGVSSISLSTTGSEQEGVRACTSRMREELYPVMEERMKAFHEDHP